MEFIVISGGAKHQREDLANRLRAHGYRFYSPEMYFMDDFGDIHIDSTQQEQADHWCLKHAALEVAHHRDVVCTDIMISPALVSQAEEEGFKVVDISLEESSPEMCEAQIEAMIAQHDQTHPSFLKKLTAQLLG
jgi:hypothetical protein